MSALMKNTIISTTYYNAPHFMEVQLESFRKFITDEFDFVVIDDSDDDTKSLISGKLSREEIRSEASRLGLRYVQVPQNIHRNIKDGGLVPDSLPAGHPTERHRACLHWILKNHKDLGFDEYKTFMLAESDMFVKKTISISNYMENYDLIGTGRSSHVKRTPEVYWPSAIDHIEELDINFFTMYLTMFNMNTIKNLETINIGGFAGTDTGGQSSFFLSDNPDYKYLFLHIGNNREDQLDFFSKNTPNENDSEFIHYRAGSNWDHQSLDYYIEKFNRLMKKYIPELKNGLERDIVKNLTSRDGEHTFFKN